MGRKKITDKYLIEEVATKVEKKRIKDFLNGEVKDFAQYVLRTRAMPNIMDGLRIGARKIIYAAQHGEIQKKSKVKMPSLLGDVFKLHYNHGDVSLMNTIIQLASNHVMKYSPLEVIGQIGSLRVPKCTTAPRYLHIKKTDKLNLFGYDKELLEHAFDDGDKVEPNFYLPIIPIMLLWRTNSPGFGFSYRCFSYDIDSIIDNCLQSINYGSCYLNNISIPLIPTVEGIKPENMIFNSNKESWYNVGEYKLNFDEDICIINDLPFNVSSEKYEEHLNTLIEKGYLKNYTDLGIDGNIKYILKFAVGRLKILSEDKWNFFKTLKLFSKIPKDTLNVIDENGKSIIFFDNPYDLIDTFVSKRLKYYVQRKTKTIEVLMEKIDLAEMHIKFIRMVASDQLIINKRPISDIKKDLDNFSISHDVLKLNISKLTKDEIDSLENNIIEMQNLLEYIRKTSIEEMYTKDLILLKSNFSTIVKM